MTLFKKIFSVLSFGGLQVVLSKFISLIQFAILVRLLSISDIGVIGLAGGYAAILSFILVSPEGVLVRDFKKIQPNLNVYISSFLQFLVVRNLLVFFLWLFLSIFLFPIQDNPKLLFYFMLLLLYNLIFSFSNPLREAFYGYYRQARIMLVDIFINILLLASMVVLFFSRDVITYGVLQVVGSIIGVIWWYWNARRYLNFSFVGGLNIRKWNIRLSLDTIRQFGVWNHLSWMILRLVYQVDIVLLGFFVSLETLGSYAVALTIANVFLVFPLMLQKVLSLSLSQIENKTVLQNIFGVIVRYNTIFSLAQLIGFVFLGGFIINIFGPDNPGAVWLYSLYIIAGITLFNIVRPWTSLAFIRLSPREYFLGLYAAPALCAVPIYYLAAQYGGALGVAQANVITFGIIALWVVFYVRYRVRLSPNLKFVSASEKFFAERLVRYFYRK